jgi:HPt (histidine-containing phosphotransfer) domain-containing protein
MTPSDPGARHDRPAHAALVDAAPEDRAGRTDRTARMIGPEPVAAVARAWQDLVDELDGDAPAVDRFATIWLELLPRRLTSCRRALARDDREAARVRLLTLHSSAVMLGLDEFARTAWRCQAALDEDRGDDDAASARALARTLMDEAQTAATLVRAALGQGRWSKR